MTTLIVLFWISLAIVGFTYVGYGIVLRLILAIRNRSKGLPHIPVMEEEALPTVTVLIAAYNEADVIEAKLRNTLALDYPRQKLEILCVTDGSSDDTPERVAAFQEVRLMHEAPRKGKLAAVHRVVPSIQSEVIVFTDANTLLNPGAIRQIVRHYADPTVGGVSGEKRVHMDPQDTASSSGEGFYWKYESLLKRMDSDLYSVVGAAGELFSVRRELFRDIPADTIIEDFYLTVSIAMDGYRIVYEPGAYAVETASANVAEEYKRKVRISAGGFQAIYRLFRLFNPFVHGWLSFVFVGHRVLRWTLCPLSLMLLLIITPILAWTAGGFFVFALGMQILIMGFAISGKIMEARELSFKAFFVPYYFFVMNISVVQGFFRFLSKQQQVTWQKAERKKMAIK